MINKHYSTRELIQISMFTAIMVVFAQIAIPLPVSPIPLTLSTFAIFLSSSFLTPQCAFMVQVIYILLGAIGFPVFSGFKSGIQVISGPTGGYIISYLIMAPLISFLSVRLQYKTSLLRKIRVPLSHIISYAVAMVFCYGFGSLWLMLYIKVPFSQALALAVTPYLLADTLKIVLCSFIVFPLKKALASFFPYRA